MDESYVVDEIPDGKETQRVARFPAISLSAEYLVMGHLLCRNVLTYKAPPMNEGYDLICIHPDPRKASRQLRVQVKSRYATDCDRGFPGQRAVDQRVRLPRGSFPERGLLPFKGEEARSGRRGGGAGILRADARVSPHTLPQEWQMGKNHAAWA